MDKEQNLTAVKRELDALVAEFFRAVKPAVREHPCALYRAWLADQEHDINAATPEISGVRRFIEPRRAMVSRGELTRFRELELSETTEVFGNVAHRYSAYPKSGTTNGVPFEARGVISTQLVKTPAGWKMSAMAWDDERPGLSLPEHLLPN